MKRVGIISILLFILSCNFASATTVLTCVISGNVGQMHFANKGDRPDFNCKAHCEWLSASTRFTGDFNGFDIYKNENKTRWSKDYGQKLLKAEKASLTCN